MSGRHTPPRRRAASHYTSPDLPTAPPGVRQIPLPSVFGVADHPATGHRWLLFTTLAIEATFSPVITPIAALIPDPGVWRFQAAADGEIMPTGVAVRLGDSVFPPFLAGWAGDTARPAKLIPGLSVTVGAGSRNLPGGARFHAGLVTSADATLNTLVPWVVLEACRRAEPNIALEIGPAGPGGVLAVGGRSDGRLRFLIPGTSTTLDGADAKAVQR